MKIMKILSFVLAVIGVLLLIISAASRFSYDPYTAKLFSLKVTVRSLLISADSFLLLAILFKVFEKK